MATTKTPKPPPKVRVAGKDYRVEVLPRSDMDDGALGTFDRVACVIALAAEQAPAEKAESLLHELLHAVASNHKLGLGDEAEETVVNAFSRGLFAILRDNPKLVKYLTA